MNRAENAGYDFRAMDDIARIDSPVRRLNSLAKLIMTIAYILTAMSFYKYDVSGLFFMLLFPVIGYQLAGIPIRLCFYKLRVVMPLVCIIGILNPFFDTEVMMYIGRIGISGGVISMFTLIIKGILCLLATFLLVATTPVEEICATLGRLRVPSVIVALILLTYRYIGLMLSEAAILTTAYHLRAPGQKGIHVSAWGSFLGQLLLRSMDRAENLYDSMLLRGYSGDVPYVGEYSNSFMDYLVVCLVIAFILLARIYNIPVWLGNCAVSIARMWGVI